MSIQESSVILRSDHVLSTEIDNEVVLMHTKNGQYYGLDAISGYIWQKLEAPILVSDLFSQLIQEYQGEEERIRLDSLRLLDKMLTSKLIEIKD